jgi:hypothetical protein
LEERILQTDKQLEFKEQPTFIVTINLHNIHQIYPEDAFPQHPHPIPLCNGECDGEIRVEAQVAGDGASRVE